MSPARWPATRLNSSALSPVAAQAAAAAGLAAECRNPFRSIVVRAVEVVYAIEEALRIIDSYERPARPFVDVPARPGIGHGVSEAPRGCCITAMRSAPTVWCPRRR